MLAWRVLIALKVVVRPEYCKTDFWGRRVIYCLLRDILVLTAIIQAASKQVAALDVCWIWTSDKLGPVDAELCGLACRRSTTPSIETSPPSPSHYKRITPATISTHTLDFELDTLTPNITITTRNYGADDWHARRGYAYPRAHDGSAEDTGLTRQSDGIHVDMGHLKSGEVK